jgi:hypothetical protein
MTTSVRSLADIDRDLADLSVKLREAWSQTNDSAMTVLQCAANRLLEERLALTAAAPVSRAPALDRQHPRITREQR